MSASIVCTRDRRRPRRVLVSVAVMVALVAAACSSSGDDAAPEDAAPDDATAADTSSTGSLPYEIPEYDASELTFAGKDFQLPEDLPDGPIGSVGFSRFVYNQTAEGEVVPTFVEGPPGRQVRCQQIDQDCSYQELKALYDSDEPLPDYLDMDRETLGELVGQLDRVNAAVTEYTTIDLACERGFRKTTNQTANMGIHMLQGNLTSEFDPDRPKMILFARDGGQAAGQDDVGFCRGDSWVGPDDYVAVGAVFNLPLSDTHPDGFAGDLDNWHIHYNTCLAPTSGTDSVGSKSDCDEAGGSFVPFIPSWMMHAYVADGFEAQAGVFSMFNPAVWPVVDSPETLRQQGTQQLDGAVNATISNFDYGTIEAAVGEPVVFSNSDAVPHTVTSGTSLDPTADFDSGLLGTGQSYELSFDTPGQYQLFCALHPDMQAVVSVG